MEKRDLQGIACVKARLNPLQEIGVGKPQVTTAKQVRLCLNPLQEIGVGKLAIVCGLAAVSAS